MRSLNRKGYYQAQEPIEKSNVFYHTSSINERIQGGFASLRACKLRVICMPWEKQNLLHSFLYTTCMVKYNAFFASLR